MMISFSGPRRRVAIAVPKHKHLSILVTATGTWFIATLFGLLVETERDRSLSVVQSGVQTEGTGLVPKVTEPPETAKEHPVVQEKAAAAAAAGLPRACSSRELETIRHQLPPRKCRTTAKRPWVNQCSFSYATRCPDNGSWLEKLYQFDDDDSMPQQKQQQRTAIFVGCNKGMDAVNALRMLSSDPSYDKSQWRETFAANQTMRPGHCGQEYSPQFAIQGDKSRKSDAVVHCIEAMPVTANRLQATAQELHWDDHLRVLNAAMGGKDGKVYFPDAGSAAKQKSSDQKAIVGIEQQGIANCKQNNPGQDCKQIPMLTLDSFIQSTVLQSPDELKERRIDYLSIDVEGFDRDVLMGANETLSQVSYLEFEYNWRGNWWQNNKHASLSSTITHLKEVHGFICYWAGTHENLWRITDCFLDHYDLHHWSNVACVNGRDPQSRPLLNRMEELFHATLAWGNQISYSNSSTINTNGRTFVQA